MCRFGTLLWPADLSSAAGAVRADGVMVILPTNYLSSFEQEHVSRHACNCARLGLLPQAEGFLSPIVHSNLQFAMAMIVQEFKG